MNPKQLDAILKELKKQTKLLEKIEKATTKESQRVIRPFSPMQLSYESKGKDDSECEI